MTRVIPLRAMGPRVHLRYPTPRDRAEYVALKLASRRFLAPWESTPTDGSDTFSAAAFDRMLVGRKSGLNHPLLICLNDTGAIIGKIGLGNIVRGAFQSCYLGYWIGARYAHRGFMTEAVGLALVFAFGTLGLHRVEANIVPRNKASLRLVKKLGFRYEGTARRYLRINGRWEDHEHWAMTADEPPPRITRTRARSRAST